MFFVVTLSRLFFDFLSLPLCLINPEHVFFIFDMLLVIRSDVIFFGNTSSILTSIERFDRSKREILTRTIQFLCFFRIKFLTISILHSLQEETNNHSRRSVQINPSIVVLKKHPKTTREDPSYRFSIIEARARPIRFSNENPKNSIRRKHTRDPISLLIHFHR